MKLSAEELFVVFELGFVQRICTDRSASKSVSKKVLCQVGRAEEGSVY